MVGGRPVNISCDPKAFPQPPTDWARLLGELLTRSQAGFLLMLGPYDGVTAQKACRGTIYSVPSVFCIL